MRFVDDRDGTHLWCRWCADRGLREHLHQRILLILHLIERPRGPSKKKAESWKFKWRGITRRFDIMAKPVQWLGFFLDCRLNWQAHIRHRLALGYHRLRSVMNAMRYRRNSPGKSPRHCVWCQSPLGRVSRGYPTASTGYRPPLAGWWSAPSAPPKVKDAIRAAHRA
jgi:hypothetical protein